MGKIRIKIWGGKDTIRIKNKNNEEIGLATDREDYHEEIVKMVLCQDLVQNKMRGSAS